MIKIIQIFDYQGFINVKKPSNVDSVFQMFNSDFLSLVPNPLSREEYEDDSDDDVGGGSMTEVRRLQESSPSSEQKCPKDQVMRDNEFSCYFLNSSGQHIIHGSIYIILKILLIFLIHCACQTRIKNFKSRMDRDKREKEQKVPQLKSPKIEPAIDNTGEKFDRQESQREKLTFAQRFIRLMIKLNLKINVKFFMNVLATFQIDFLMSALGNFRFLRTNSAFAVISLICCILFLLIVLYAIVISTRRMHQIKMLSEKM